MSCDLNNLSAYNRPCKSVGGVKRFFYWDRDQRIADGIIISSVDGLASIAAGTVTPDAYEVIPEQDNWNLTQPVTDNNVNGTSYVTQTFQGNLMGYTPELVALADDLRKGRFEVLAELEDNTLVVVGLGSRGLQSGGGDHGFSGTVIGDAVGFNVVLTNDAKATAPVLLDILELETAFNVVPAIPPTP